MNQIHYEELLKAQSWNTYAAKQRKANPFWTADLGEANLGGAYLREADLREADLGGAYLREANLGGANLGGADLGEANLGRANLGRANLGGADLGEANLGGANLDPIAVAELSIVPESGAFDGWKKCKNNVIVCVRIPADSRRSNATGRKCRAEAVEVIEVFGASEGISQYNPAIIYRKGETVRCHEWDDNRWEECSGGIHFFLTRIEAENY